MTNAERIHNISSENTSARQPGKEIENFQSIDPGTVCLIKNESNSNSAVFLVQHETFLGTENPGAYKSTLTKENIEKLPIIDDQKIKEYQQDKDYIYTFHEYSVLDHKIIWRQKTDLDYGHGSEVTFRPFVYESTKTELSEIKNVFEGSIVDSLGDEKIDMSYGGLIMIQSKEGENAVDFYAQDRTPYGEPNPSMVHKNQTKSDLLNLPTITLKEISQVDDEAGHWTYYYHFKALGETIIWKESTTRGGDFEGNEIEYSQYRLTNTNRVNLE